MSKELFISSSPHEMKVAVSEDDQLVEVYFQRDTDVGLVGGIYKGRVSRVLPGMQSAFVDIGLERDAFLYVSDFFEDAEEYEKIVEEAESRVLRDTGGAPVSGSAARAAQGEASAGEAAVQGPPEAGSFPAVSSETSEAAGAQPGAPAVSTTLPAPPAPAKPAAEGSEHRRHQQRGRRRHRRGRGFGEHKFTPKADLRNGAPPPFEILPGESLAKYSHVTPETISPAAAIRTSEASSVESSRTVLAPPEVHGPQVQTPGGKAFEQAPSTSLPLAGERLPVEETAPTQAAPAPTGPSAEQAAASFQPPFERATAEAPIEAPRRPQLEDTSITKPQLLSEIELPAGAQVPAKESGEVSGVPAPVFSDSLPVAAPESPVQKESPPKGPAPVEVMAERAAPTAAIPTEGPSLETPSQPAERSYTLREPHQRPRFAPRRGRRGRRGMGHRTHRLVGTPTSRNEPSRAGTQPTPQISELLKEGQEILVQIAKGPLGRKGARITSHIALPGRYLVYMPTIDHIGVSRKIASEEERLRLRNVVLENKGPLTGGFIVRTAGEGRSEEDFKADLKFLSTLWNEIKAKADRSRAPALIHRDLDLVQRLLRDVLSPDFKSIRVDNEIEYERVLDFVSRLQPSLVGQVKLYTRDTPLFDEFGIQEEIEKALKPKVWLRSGGYIVINQTEALVAIDVNTGKYVGNTNRLEDTIVKTNIDAVNEIVRQIRLRDLGGIIVIDFIDMDERRNRNKVVQALEDALRRDRAPNKIVAFNDFGLVAITRKRVRHSLERTLCEPCNNCLGSGWIKSVTTVCYEILAEARKMASQIEGKALTLRVNPEVAHALKSREGSLIAELESLAGKDVIIKSDPTVHQERFEIF